MMIMKMTMKQRLLAIFDAFPTLLIDVHNYIYITYILANSI